MAQGPGRMLGAYQVGPFLGAGPVGDVFRAQGGTDASELAIKILRLPFATSPQVRQKFGAICATVAGLDHPHILPLTYFGEQGNQSFTVMPLVAQGSLMARLGRGRLSPKDVAPLFNQICDALNYVHGQGMVHGNLKPTNVLLFEGRHCLLSDFGQLWQVTEVDLTQSGISAEATYYMAPEQTDGYVDARSDIYSLGAILFHALAGQPPYPGQTPFEVLSRHNRQPIPALSALNQPVAEGALAFEDVLRIALAKNPAERFQSPLAMARAITEAGALANDLPSRAVPVVRPGQPPLLPPGAVSPVPSRPNPAYGPMPGQMMPSAPRGPMPGQMLPPGAPYGPPMLPPSGTGGGPLFPGQVPAPNSRPRQSSQPLPPPNPPMQRPGSDDARQWPPPGAPPTNPPPQWAAPRPPNRDAADFLTARHSADDIDRILAQETGMVSPPTVETGAAPRADWRDDYDDDRRGYTDDRAAVGDRDAFGRDRYARDGYTDDQPAVYDRRDDRDWDDSRSVSVPSMRTPSRPASRDRWEESDARYRRDEDYSREMASERVAARPYDATGRGAATPQSGRMAAHGEGGRAWTNNASVVIPAPKKRSRLPAILFTLIIVVLLANVGLLTVAAPQYCPNHICDGVHNRLAPIFGLKTTVPTTLSAALTKPSTTFTVKVAATATTKGAITLAGGASSAAWTAAVDLPWVRVAPTGGTFTPNTPTTLDVTLAPDVTVPAGSYTATITITADGQTATVKLPITVTAAS